MSDDRQFEERGATWPIDVGGVVESIVATRGPNGRWNFAVLGVHLDEARENETNDETDRTRVDGADGVGGTDGANEANGATEATTARAYTWGRTRTWRNFHEHGTGHIQFVRDPVLFVEAALGIHERDDPIHPAADAWVRVAASQVGVEIVGDTRREAWQLRAIETTIEHRRVPRTRRGYAAVVEATVAASRLDVPTYDTAVLRERLEYFERVVERCGDEHERAAMARLHDLLDEE